MNRSYVTPLGANTTSQIENQVAFEFAKHTNIMKNCVTKANVNSVGIDELKNNQDVLNAGQNTHYNPKLKDFRMISMMSIFCWMVSLLLNQSESNLTLLISSI